MFGLLLLLLCCRAALTEPRYYVVLRVPEPTQLEQLSAQFKLLQPVNSSTGWDCASGPNPIVYPAGAGHEMRAKSIDVGVGSVVECLGLQLRVVVVERATVWEGEGRECGGFLTSTTELERSEGNTTQYFQLTPTRSFHVYSTVPSGTCAPRALQYVESPDLGFSYLNNIPTTCNVLSTQLDELSCNMTITSRDDDVIATAIEATRVHIPRFIWNLKLNTVICSSVCELRDNSDTNSVPKHNSLRYNTPENPNPTPEPFSSVERPGGPENCSIYIIVTCVMTALLFISTVTAIFFMNLSRDLNRRLGRLGARPPAPSFHPDIYRDVGSIRNECHHYNTVSLRLAECVEVGRTQTYERPVYQKLSHFQDKNMTS